MAPPEEAVLKEHADERHGRSRQLRPPWRNMPMSAMSGVVRGGAVLKNLPMSAMSGAAR